MLPNCALDLLWWEVQSLHYLTRYRFNFEVLSKPKGEIFEYQEELTTHLDEVEVNLFYQINSRFD